MPSPATAVGTAPLRAAGATHPGRVRSENEDRLYIDAERGFFLVADGVGGHAAGEVAASIAVDVIAQRLERPTWTAEQRVREAVALANNEILKQAQELPQHAGMTCVLTLAVITGERVTIGHVGDSRLYKLTGDGIVKLTHDHSPVGEREDAGELSEVDAMRHPRRNEVFRDVGSAFREPDDRDFVEVVEATFESGSALLLCSDGLSDMLQSAEIVAIVRAHAGQPAAVAEALVAAANEAGGKDNVTVVYVEGDTFAAAVTAPGALRAVPSVRATPSSLHRVGSSRLTWLLAGVLAGLCGGLALAFWPGLDPMLGSRGRTLPVGTGDGQYRTIAAALASARPRDVIQLEPGDYIESVVLVDGMSLVARVPGSVTLRAPLGRPDWTSIALGGTAGGRIAGLRIVGSGEAPMDAAVRLAGHDLVVDDVAIEGDLRRGIDITGNGSVQVRASRFANVSGTAIQVAGEAAALIRHNVFVRTGSGETPAIDVAATAQPLLEANLFVGYVEALAPAARREQLLRGNYVMPRLQEAQPVQETGRGAAAGRAGARPGAERRPPPAGRR